MKLLTLREVAEAMKVSESTVRRWIRAGALTAYKVGQRGQLRVRDEDLERYLETQVVRVGASDTDLQAAAAHDGGTGE